MPQRLAEIDPFTAITEVVGSGPFRFVPDERVQGSLFVYRKFDQYKPREHGESSFTSGPKIVHFDRVEWHVQPDAATKAAAMQAGEMDWWENPPADLLPLLTKANIRTEITDHTGNPYVLKPNHLYPPFDKPAVGRALLGAIDQKEFMTAMMGDDTSLWSTPLGFFAPSSPLASNVGMSALTGPRDYGAVKTALEKAGYQGETVALMSATDQPTNYPLALVAADMLKRVGVSVSYQATDWGTVVQRRAITRPPSEGGWNLFCTGFSGLEWFSPASNLPLRGNGKNAWFGVTVCRRVRVGRRRADTICRRPDRPG
jgi:peptide/nickel transport system substrate-binding protein